VKRIAMAYAKFTGAKIVAVGRDVRLSGPKLQKSVIDGLLEAGVNVEDIGPVPTDMMYFAVGYYHFDGGIQVSASHNPAEFNGLKMVRQGVEAISSDTGLNEIRELAESNENLSALTPGKLETKEVEEDYFDFLTKFVHFDAAEPLKIVANNNFGLSGVIVQKFLNRIHNQHIQLIELNFTPDGSFPKGRPDPLVLENRKETIELITEAKADFGAAWDADGDRFFVIDELGQFVDGSYLTALLASELLLNTKGEKILHDPRNIWAVEETVKKAGGVPIMVKHGHTFIKNRMKDEDALFAGEMSGHYYFRDFYYADNGLIPFLLVLNLMARSGKKVSEIIQPFRDRYFVSGEINFAVEDKEVVAKMIEEKYSTGQVDRTDGLSITFDNWRFNLVASNTENLLRLNVEARTEDVCKQKTDELSELVKGA
jgi:phosphomannomutase